MIIKNKDSKQSEIDELNSLLALPLPESKRFLVERELRAVRAGDKGEDDSAYLINFYYGLSDNWAVIHDLRLVCQDRVAQIDHLLINRIFEMYILESKSYAYGIKITDTGEFMVSYNSQYFGIDSPIEQNKRHAFVLEKSIRQYDIMPRRLGITIAPSILSYILVSTKSRIIRPNAKNFNTDMVIKADMLKSIIEKSVDNMNTLSACASISKFSSSETLKEVATRLVSLHTPIKFNYRKRFGITDEAPKEKPVSVAQEKGPAKSYYCSKCNKSITYKVAAFCWDNKKRFGGKAYCFDCQKGFRDHNEGQKK